MVDLWYDYDEVNDFHPVVETALNEAIDKKNLSRFIEVVHHPRIGSSSTTPDFGIRLKSSGRYIFIIEVKKTQRSVDSQRFGNQTRSYVQDSGAFWENGFHHYFCITNVEKLILYANREGPINSCILKNNPYLFGQFDANTHSADPVIENFKEKIADIIELIFDRSSPEWSNNWPSIIHEFSANYQGLASHLNLGEDISKELALYELFRLTGYLFLKEYYNLNNSPGRNFFRNLPDNSSGLEQYKRMLVQVFNRILTLDFQQIFENHPDSSRRIFPENFDDFSFSTFSNFLNNSARYSGDAIQDNPSPSYFFNLLVEEIYEREELHNKGKIMTDPELAVMMATLCIENDESIILDPGCGGGSFLDAAYDLINMKSLSNRVVKSHNEILNQLHGLEIDPFLAQLATFRLLSKNLNNVDEDTKAKVKITDVFSEPRPELYDVILMNPPFLRNDDPNAPITAEQKEVMIQAILDQNLPCFVSEARQPNLYFYFVNYIWHYLNDGGKAAIILMTKFLNNKDGEHLKQFILDKIESIITYPKSFFSDFKVTTSIVILKKESDPSEQVSFLRILDSNLLLEPQQIKSILSQGSSNYNADYTLKVVDRGSLIPSENWRLYLIDPEEKFNDLFDLDLFNLMTDCFDLIKRGSAANSGGSTEIYPNDSLIEEFSIEDEFIGYGLKNNRVNRKFILTEQSLSIEKALHPPSRYDDNSTNGLNSCFGEFSGIADYYGYCESKFGRTKWKKIVNEIFNSKVIPQLIIPRADRIKHIVYCNPLELQTVISTNFVYFCDFNSLNETISEEIQLKFITAFLLSSFGQIQFELAANDQEGLRKLEMHHMESFKIIDVRQLNSDQIQKTVDELEALNNLNTLLSGDEGTSTDRRNLDISIGEIIFNHNDLGFISTEDMVDYFELALCDLVEARRQ